MCQTRRSTRIFLIVHQCKHPDNLSGRGKPQRKSSSRQSSKRRYGFVRVKMGSYAQRAHLQLSAIAAGSYATTMGQSAFSRECNWVSSCWRATCASRQRHEILDTQLSTEVLSTTCLGPKDSKTNEHKNMTEAPGYQRKNRSHNTTKQSKTSKTNKQANKQTN